MANIFYIIVIKRFVTHSQVVSSSIIIDCLVGHQVFITSDLWNDEIFLLTIETTMLFYSIAMWEHRSALTVIRDSLRPVSRKRVLKSCVVGGLSVIHPKDRTHKMVV